MIKSKVFEDEVKMNEFVANEKISVISVESFKIKKYFELPPYSGYETDGIKLWYNEEKQSL